MLKSMAHIIWDQLDEMIPSLVTMIMIPLSFSIADGIGIGFIVYAAIKILSGQIKQLNPFLLH